jgi:hypothetical protein
MQQMSVVASEYRYIYKVRIDLYINILIKFITKIKDFKNKKYKNVNI